MLDRIALHVRAEARRLGRPARVIDPFAGVGRIHDLPRRIADTVGVELEPEWAACRARTVQGDATCLLDSWVASFDVLASSPCYGNRLADSHEARDACRGCEGTGVVATAAGCADAPWLCPDCQRVDCACGGLAAVLRRHNAGCPACRTRVCPACGGNGLSKRYTYRHALGRMPSEGSAATMQWGGMYRALHKRAWAEARRVVVDGGLGLVNCKNHIRDGHEQKVVEWHAECLAEVGWAVEAIHDLPGPGLRHAGTNGEARVDHERLIVARAT